MMAWMKAKTFAVVVVASMICGTGGVMSVQRAMAQNGGGNASAKPQAVAAAVPKAVDQNAPSLESAPPVVVIETVPQSGASDVDPSTTEIKVTYSKEMHDGSWSWSTWGEENFPKMTDKPHYLDDKRTCVAPVKLEPGKFYAIWLNSENFGNFKDANGQAALPYLLVFKTKK